MRTSTEISDTFPQHRFFTTMESKSDGEGDPDLNSEVDRPPLYEVAVTVVVAATHKRFAGLNTAYRAFIATGTWLPLSGSKNNEVTARRANVQVLRSSNCCHRTGTSTHSCRRGERSTKDSNCKNLADEKFLQLAKNTKDEMEARQHIHMHSISYIFYA